MIEWNGKILFTTGDVLDAAIDAMEASRAQEFLSLYRSVAEYADTNLGYLFGYCDEDTRKRLYSAYQLSHPIFGTTS